MEGFRPGRADRRTARVSEKLATGLCDEQGHDGGHSSGPDPDHLLQRPETDHRPGARRGQDPGGVPGRRQGSRGHGEPRSALGPVPTGAQSDDQASREGARQEAAGLLPDASQMPSERAVEHDRHLYVRGRVERAACGRITVHADVRLRRPLLLAWGVSTAVLGVPALGACGGEDPATTKTAAEAVPGRGSDRKPCPPAGSKAVNFSAYYLGNSFQGMQLQKTLRNCTKPTRGQARVNYVSFIYGDCVATSDTGCAPPF